MAKQDKNYVSELDKFLQQFDKDHQQQSASQQEEIDKHDKIFAKRDNPDIEDKDDNIWAGF